MQRLQVTLESGDVSRVEDLARRLGVGASAAARFLLRVGLGEVARNPGALGPVAPAPTVDPGRHRAVIGDARHRAVPTPVPASPVDELTPAQRQRAQELGLLPPQA